jgi:hypothetical protein
MVCCIVGAGYSSVAGDPLTPNLLSAPVISSSHKGSLRFERVQKDFQAWSKDNLSNNSEQYLEELYLGKRDGFISFKAAVELIAATLSTSAAHIAGVSIRYAARVTRPSNCRAHIDFWRTVMRKFDDLVVVTTNYDFRIEQVLRHKPMKRPPTPGFYYGGLERPQILEGTALPFTVTNQQRYVELTGSIPLFKLHGSLNWSLEGGGMKLYQDMRPAFRHRGDAAIVPPLYSKQIPDWLAPVWTGAALEISRCTTWIVCGYSLPWYDRSIMKLLHDSSGNASNVYLLSPHSKNSCDRWQRVAQQAQITPLSGLPDGIDELRKAIHWER